MPVLSEIDFSALHVVGRCFGLMVRSMANPRVPFPEWFWRQIVQKSQGDPRYEQHAAALRSGLCFVLPRCVLRLFSVFDFELIDA